MNEKPQADIALARQLRNALTPQEAKLWLHLRSWRGRGYHFRRQVPRDGYVLDFACLQQMLIIEVDGNQHGFDVNAASDEERDRHFCSVGFTVRRFTNDEVNRNLAGVLETIDRALRRE